MVGDVTHVAIVVDDLSLAMDRYARSLGVGWAVPWTGAIPVVVDGEPAEPEVRFTYSIEGPPHLELIEGIEDTVWQRGNGLHHAGFWSDDVEGEADGLAATGWEVETRSPSWDFAYLRSADGARIELTDRSARPRFAAWLAGGSL